MHISHIRQTNGVSTQKSRQSHNFQFFLTSNPCTACVSIVLMPHYDPPPRPVPFRYSMIEVMKKKRNQEWPKNIHQSGFDNQDIGSLVSIIRKIIFWIVTYHFEIWPPGKLFFMQSLFSRKKVFLMTPWHFVTIFFIRNNVLKKKKSVSYESTALCNNFLYKQSCFKEKEKCL